MAISNWRSGVDGSDIQQGGVVVGFDKEYPNRKDRRKQYYGSRAIDHTCRSHGSCPYCQRGRKHKGHKDEINVKEQLNEWRNNGNGE